MSIDELMYRSPQVREDAGTGTETETGTEIETETGTEIGTETGTETGAGTGTGNFISSLQVEECGKIIYDLLRRHQKTLQNTSVGYFSKNVSNFPDEKKTI